MNCRSSSVCCPHRRRVGGRQGSRLVKQRTLASPLARVALSRPAEVFASESIAPRLRNNLHGCCRRMRGAKPGRFPAFGSLVPHRLLPAQSALTALWDQTRTRSVCLAPTARTRAVTHTLSPGRRPSSALLTSRGSGTREPHTCFHPPQT